jgi:hypothetical protein
MFVREAYPREALSAHCCVFDSQSFLVQASAMRHHQTQTQNALRHLFGHRLMQQLLIAALRL